MKKSIGTSFWRTAIEPIRSPIMTALSELLARQMREHGLTQTEVAQRAGIKQPSVAALCSGGSKGTRYPEELALAIRAPVAWVLAANRGARPWRDLDHPDQSPQTGDLRPAPADTRRIPIISYVQAGSFCEAVDAYARGNGFDEMFIDAGLAAKLGPHAFALKVEGDSMRPDFNPGDIVVIDPDLPPRPGDIVVAKLGRESSATLKKYRDRGVDANGVRVIELVPINNDYPLLMLDASNPGTVIGPVVEVRKRLR